ncbi:MAG: nuclear transport factor 2 family protein [Pseudomonadota bacterium]|jgi:ketosteroid isomerase-like protein|uniref:nuclear transport factor 2 family protein n=1 Tax=Burkholderiaceae TaxID=119060 RepID=UPI00148511F8|nr:nuclear transport factor 2 family protein [Burkholderia sp. 4M9327F10]
MTSAQELLQLASELETRRWNLALAADITMLADLLSDDLQFVHSSGLQDDKQAYLATLETRAVIYHRADPKIQKVVPLGDQAFYVNGTVTLEATVRGTGRVMRSVFTVVWRREQDAWKLVMHQTTAMPA